jgi:hypothetical protein
MSLTTVLMLNLVLDALIFGLLALVMRTPFLLDRLTRPALAGSRRPARTRPRGAALRIVRSQLAPADRTEPGPAVRARVPPAA